MNRARNIPSIAELAGRGVRALSLAFVLMAAGSRSAAGQGLRFRHLRSDDGLAGPWVLAITQDHAGFMWFGTSTGLSRYDGYKMESYRTRNDDPRSLRSDEIYAVREDRRGDLWIGTGVGLSRYDRASNTFTNFELPAQGDPDPQRRVNAILEDSRGELWLGTTRGLLRFDRATGKSVPVALPGTLTTLSDVAALMEDRQKRIVIASRNDGLYELDPATGRMRHFAHGRPGATEIPSNGTLGVAEDQVGRLWISTYDCGLVQLDRESAHATVYSHVPNDPHSVMTNHLRTLLVDPAGWLWVASENGGLEHFNPATGEFFHSRADAGNPLGVGSDSFWSLYLDGTGTLWAGTFTAGVDVLRRASDAIQRFSATGRDSLGLSNNAVTGFAQDSSGIVWVTTDGGGLNRLDPSTGRFRHYSLPGPNINKNAMLAASVDHDGKLWVGGWENGLSLFDPLRETFTQYTTKNSTLPDDHVFAVHVDRVGRVWLGTWEHGLVQFDPATKTFTQYHTSERRPEPQLWIIREMHDGRLLLGTLSGLLLFDPVTKSMTQYNVDKTAHSIGAYVVRAVLEESPGIILIGTSAGLDRLDLSTNTTRHFTTRDGLASDMVMGLALDADRKLWVSTDRGVSRYDYVHKTSFNYTTEDGLQGREFAARAYLTGKNGMLLFGGNNGFNVIRPELLERNARKPRIAFTGFQLFNKPVVIGAPGSPLATHISEARQITLDHTQSVFTIEFAALDFTAPAKNQYAYKLEGFDQDWNYAGATRTATYTNLPAGHYVFRVRASNNDGVWNEQGASIDIVITPPFWATWWFRTLVVLLIVAVVAYIVRGAQERHRNLQAMNQQLGRAAEHDRESQQYLERNVLDILGAMQRFSGGDYSVALQVQSEDAIGKLRSGFNSVVADRKRAEEELRQSQKMEAVGRLAGGVAHDFNNLLTVIKGNAELALADIDSKEAVQAEVQEIERAAERASSLTRQLLAFSRKQILKPQTILLNEMLSDVGRMLRRTVGEDIALTVSLDPALGHVRADPGQIEQVVLNLVVNARDAMPRGGELTIETKNVEPDAVRGLAEAEAVPYVAIAVSDTGTGMPPSVLNRVFEPFFTTKEQGKGTGLGLSTVYGSVKQSGGFVHVQSELGVGSSFTVYLPRVHEPDELRATSEYEVGALGSATVLLVEDEDAVRRLGSRVLMRAGYRVLTASNGREALEVAASFTGTIDLLLTDVVMPGMSGRELAEQLLPLHSGMRLMYASGYTEDAIIRHGVSSQETAFLEKPFTPHALLRKVRQVLEPQSTSTPQLSV